MKKQTKLGLVLAAAAVISVSVASLVSARGWVQNGADWYYVDNNNEYVTDTIQSSGNAKFYLGEDGRMQRDYFLEDYNENTYYFGSNGAMVTNTWVAIESSRVDNQDDYIPDNYWYYFQASGKAMKGNSTKCKKTTIDGKKYAFNEFGQMCVGWFGEDGKTVNPDDEQNPFKEAVYYAGGDNDGVLRTGWITYYDGYDGTDEIETEYSVLYFYFNTSNNKKYGCDGAVTKKINGRTYAFTSEGVMLSGWDPYNQTTLTNMFDTLVGKTVYFSGEDDGHQVKKGWVYAVPAELIDSKKYNDDEEVYMYFQSSGDITKDTFKKINGKYYVFSRTGVMKTGVIIWSPSGVQLSPANTTDHYHYVDKLDLDYAEGGDVSKKGILQTDVDKWIKVNANGQVIKMVNTGNDTWSAGNMLNSYRVFDEFVKLHYFGDDGARRTGTNNIEFSDDTYSFQSNSNGNKDSGAFNKKYYSLGILLKASPDIRYGLFTFATPSHADYMGPLKAQSPDGRDQTYWNQNLNAGHYEVLSTSGARVKGNNNAKKDADGNYWLINRNTNRLEGIWSVNVSRNRNVGVFQTRTVAYQQGSINIDLDDATIGTGKHSKTYSYQALVDQNLAIDGAETDELNNKSWRAYYQSNNGNGTIYFVSTDGYTGGAFQSDYRDGSNKWIPAGVLDNSGKTITFNSTLNTSGSWDGPEHAYDIIPNNDYFLNCFWFDANCASGGKFDPDSTTNPDVAE